MNPVIHTFDNESTGESGDRPCESGINYHFNIKDSVIMLLIRDAHSDRSRAELKGNSDDELMTHQYQQLLTTSQ